MITRKGKPYREFRCSNCRSLLGLEYVYAGRLSIKCGKCGTMNDLEFKAVKKVLLKQLPKPTIYVKSENQKGGE